MTGRAGVFPRPAAVAYGIGFSVTLIAADVPQPVLLLGSLIAGAGMGTFARKLWNTDGPAPVG